MNSKGFRLSPEIPKGKVSEPVLSALPIMKEATDPFVCRFSDDDDAQNADDTQGTRVTASVANFSKFRRDQFV